MEKHKTQVKYLYYCEPCDLKRKVCYHKRKSTVEKHSVGFEPEWRKDAVI